MGGKGLFWRRKARREEEERRRKTTRRFRPFVPLRSFMSAPWPFMRLLNMSTSSPSVPFISLMLLMLLALLVLLMLLMLLRSPRRAIPVMQVPAASHSHPLSFSFPSLFLLIPPSTFPFLSFFFFFFSFFLFIFFLFFFLLFISLRNFTMLEAILVAQLNKFPSFLLSTLPFPSLSLPFPSLPFPFPFPSLSPTFSSPLIGTWASLLRVFTRIS